jgi:scavenger receptor class B, member 1
LDFVIFDTFREFLENKNATFNENGTLSFVPSRHTRPIPERSVGDPTKDIVIAANLPLLGLSSAATKISPFASLAVSSIVKTTNSQPILNLTVHDFLWGYEDNLVRLANTFLPNYITFERFGLMERVSFRQKS